MCCVILHNYWASFISHNYYVKMSNVIELHGKGNLMSDVLNRINNAEITRVDRILFVQL